MSTTGLDVFDSTLQKTHLWLKEIVTELHWQRNPSWAYLALLNRNTRHGYPQGSVRCAHDVPLRRTIRAHGARYGLMVHNRKCTNLLWLNLASHHSLS